MGVRRAGRRFAEGRFALAAADFDFPAFGLLLGAALAVSPAVEAHAHPDHPASPGGTPPVEEGPYRRGWRRLAPVASGPRQEHSVAAVGDKVYVIGGIVPGESGGVTTTARSGVAGRLATSG